MKSHRTSNRISSSRRCTPVSSSRIRPLIPAGLAAQVMFGVVWLATGLPAIAQDSPALPEGVTRGASVEGITEYTLENGLRVLLVPDASEPKITVNLTYLVGSRHEGYGEKGMAHLLEHLVFKGTRNHPDIPAELTSRGGKTNGTTRTDRTNYFITMPASDENLLWAINLYADTIRNALISPTDLDSEMTVVRNEWELRSGRPERLLFRGLYETAFGEHSYGHDVLGSRSDIENAPIETLLSFYDRYYRPDNAVLIVAGQISERETLAAVLKDFGAIPRPAMALPHTYTVEPPQDGERTITLRRPGAAPLVAEAYHVPPGSHADAAAVQVLIRTLAAQPAGRLHQALVTTSDASNVNCYTDRFKDPGLAACYAEVLPTASIVPVTQTLIQTMEAVADNPPSNEEVERAKQTILRSMEMNRNNPEQIGLQLSEWAAMGDWRLLFLHRDRVASVTPDDVVRVAREYFREQNRTVGLFLPSERAMEVQIPLAPDIPALVEGYEGRQEVSRGEAMDSSPDGIERRLQRTALPSGMTLSLLPKQSRGGRVVGVLRLRYADVESAFGLDATAFLTSQMLLRGSRSRSRQQIQDDLNRLKARVVVDRFLPSSQDEPPPVETHHLRTEIGLETVGENLAPLLELLAQVLREPSFPEDEFEHLKRQEIARAEAASLEPVGLAVSLFEDHLAPYPLGDPRRPGTMKEWSEALSSVTVDDLRRFHADYFGTNHAELVLVGNLDPRTIVQQTTTLLGNWESKRPHARPQYAYEVIEPVRRTMHLPDQANAALVAAMLLEVGDGHPDYPALVLGMHVLGGGWLNSRLTQRLRHRDGLSYIAAAAMLARYGTSSSRFGALTICAPENLAKAEAAMKEEIELALRDGFRDMEIAEAKKAWMQQQAVLRADDAQLANLLADNERDGRTMAWQAQLEQKVLALAAKDVNAAMVRHLRPDALSWFLAGDLERAGIE